MASEYLTAPMPQFKFSIGGPGHNSNASMPSLRSRDSSLMQPPPAPPTRISHQEGNNVRVVVRVRGLLPREVERGARCLVSMDPRTQMTTLHAPSSDGTSSSSGVRPSSRKTTENKSFTFDNSFWSVNRSDSHYADQAAIYNALGEEFLDHNFEGYHTCIFAYGQTGAGKSYSMMGTPDNPGLIPRTCEDLFDRIELEGNPNCTYNVRVSYFEVYNEHVRDLLAPRKEPPNNLKIRESPTDGPYVKDLTETTVKSLDEVLNLMRMGDASRTVASTKMNDTSSRSHAVFTLILKQIHHDIDTDEVTERIGRMRLVDLAGSERANATGATGQRLREGSNINKSLTTLGRVIAALAEASTKQSGKKKEVVPYRDSVLTWLLKDSLGGNSKTAMIACISPTDYDETLSTLRYADQAKQIRTRAVINQDSISNAERDALIEQMSDQIKTLQLQLAGGKQKPAETQSQQLEEYQLQVEKLQRLMEEQRQISEAKIKNMQSQSDALKLHLRLALDSLKNPIELSDNHSSSDEKQVLGKTETKQGRKSYWGEDATDVVDTTQEFEELENAIASLTEDVGIYRMKLRDDQSRFIRPLGEASPNIQF